MTHAIVNVATGQRYLRGQKRLHEALDLVGFRGQRYFWSDKMPPNCPPHQTVPYAFKPCAMNVAVEAGADMVLWLDASVLPIQSLQPIWDHCEESGYLFPNNGWNTGQWCGDEALPILGISREESFQIPHMAATIMALDMRYDRSRKFFTEWFRIAQMRHGVAFRGSTACPVSETWTNKKRQVSQDKRVLGHRHDQTVASVIAWRLGMKFTAQPEFFAYADYIDNTDRINAPDERTILLAAGRY